MRSDVSGARGMRILLAGEVGFKSYEKSLSKRRRVDGVEGRRCSGGERPLEEM